MKITITITILVLIFILAGALVSPANAVRIEALPIGEGTEIGEIINTIYKNALGLGGIAALVMITIGAVYFTLSGASPDKQSEGKNYIASALWGLLLLFGAFIILNTINPQIIKLAEPGGEKIKNITLPPASGSARVLCAGLFEACKAVYKPFFDRDKYVLQSKYKIAVFDCKDDTDCVDSIKTRYVEMASGTQIYPEVLISGLDNLVQACAVKKWGSTGMRASGRGTTVFTGSFGESDVEVGDNGFEIEIDRIISGEGACSRVPE